MEKIECKACSAIVDKSVEFCSSCGEWLGLSMKDIEGSDVKREPKINRRKPNFNNISNTSYSSFHYRSLLVYKETL